jgi:tRNA threonylcarbamoyl adenosine modification protein (Sua5/YciO/YrdC/YwlC family)
MADYIEIHPENPQQRLIQKVAERLRAGEIAAIPTDSCYALTCHIGDKAAQERIARIRQFDKSHHFTLLCADLSELGTYAAVNKSAYRILRHHTPGPFTFILNASREVPRRLANPKRKTIGLRIPDHPIVHALLAEMGEPLLSVTCIVPPNSQPLTDAGDIIDALDKHIDLIIDGGHCGIEPTTVVDLETNVPEILRQGRGQCDLG